MVIILGLRWWYSSGWGWVWKRSIVDRMQWCFRFFSVPELAKTWFSPFKQTYNSNKRGSIDAKIQSAVDNFVSRIIGSIARSILIFCGLISAVVAIVTGLLFIATWPFIPVLPLISLLLTAGVIK